MSNRTPQVIAALLLAVCAAATIYFGFFSDGRARAKAEWDQWDSAVGNLDSELKGLAQKIRSVQGEGKCEVDTQCRVVGLGARACGLYKDFLVYSVLDTDEPALLELVKELNKKHEKRVDMSLSADNCGKSPAPVHCVENRCAVGGV